jgi:hypothetical protein
MINTGKIGYILDKYFFTPIRYDFIMVVVLLIVEYLLEIIWVKYNLPKIKILDRATELNYISSLISGSIALAGFMVAALTIFITVKASLKARGIEDAENALDIIFSTGHYKTIIAVFKHTIVELIAIFILLYLAWIYSANLSDLFIFKIAISSVFIIALSVTRSLYILFAILGLENYKKEE